MTNPIDFSRFAGRVAPEEVARWTEKGRIDSLPRSGPIRYFTLPDLDIGEVLVVKDADTRDDMRRIGNCVTNQARQRGWYLRRVAPGEWMRLDPEEREAWRNRPTHKEQQQAERPERVIPESYTPQQAHQLREIWRKADMGEEAWQAEQEAKRQAALAKRVDLDNLPNGFTLRTARIWNAQQDARQAGTEVPMPDRFDDDGFLIDSSDQENQA